MPNVQQPQTTNPTVGYPVNLSGTIPTSGTFVDTVDLNPPYFVETQTLNIEYWRVPHYGSVSSAEVNLSSASVTYSPTPSTRFVCKVNAEYESHKDWNYFDLSTYQQPQEFEAYAVSADLHGNTYGTLNASSLGPMGKIVTTVPWYRRVKWNDASGHAEAKQSVEAWTFAATTSGATVAADTIITDYQNFFIAPAIEGTLLADWEPTGHYGYSIANIPGQYAVVKESPQITFDTVEYVANLVEGEDLYKTIATYTNGIPVGDQGVPLYDKTRHKYD